MPEYQHIKSVNFPDKTYSIIYADPPWAYRQCGTSDKSRGNALKHYRTMATEEICSMPIPSICADGGAACFMWATFPNIGEAVKVMEAWGFQYKTAAFVWVKKNRKNGGNFWGMGAYTRANAEVCLLGVTPDFKAGERIKSHKVHQIIEAPFEGHSKKPDEARRRIVELLGDVPRIELFARQRVDGWDAWGDEVPQQKGEAPCWNAVASAPGRPRSCAMHRSDEAEKGGGIDAEEQRNPLSHKERRQDL